MPRADSPFLDEARCIRNGTRTSIKNTREISRNIHREINSIGTSLSDADTIHRELNGGTSGRAFGVCNLYTDSLGEPSAPIFRERAHGLQYVNSYTLVMNDEAKPRDSRGYAEVPTEPFLRQLAEPYPLSNFN